MSHQLSLWWLQKKIEKKKVVEVAINQMNIRELVEVKKKKNKDTLSVPSVLWIVSVC